MPWIYQYLDGARNEVDMGLYDTKEQCKLASKEHASFGAMVSPPIEVPEDYKLYKPDYEKE